MTKPQSSEDIYGHFLGVKVHTLIAWGCVITAFSVGVGVGYGFAKSQSPNCSECLKQCLTYWEYEELF